MDTIFQGRGNARLVLGFFVLLVSLLFGSCYIAAVEAAEQHQVGGPPGWSLPARANVNYTVWASTHTFKIGDTLYFNYSNAYHNVVEVTKANYESCNASKSIEEWTEGADVIPLKSSGTFYYICGFSGHCEAGQKVAVEVEMAAAGTQHQVGGSPGWSLPSRSNVNYTVWASTQTFLVGDTLYFNYSSQYHNVWEVTKANYDACGTSDAIEKWDDGATMIHLNKTGTFYYICGVAGHCSAGQKVAVTVTSSALSNGGAPGAAPAPQGSPGVPSLAPASSCPLSHPISPLSSLLGLALSLIILTSVALPY